MLCVRVGYEDTYQLPDLWDSSFLLASQEFNVVEDGTQIMGNVSQLQPGALGERG